MNRYESISIMPHSVWVIGWMCFFWSFSSYMVCSILPSFLKETFNASYKTMGFIESIAIFLSFCTKFFSGFLSDYFQKRQPLILIGTLTALVGKIGFIFASSPLHVLFARAWDRVVKGIRATPTDALIADCSSQKKRAQNYGIRQMLYSLGNVIGGGVTTILMYYSHKNYRLIFFLSIIPSLIAFTICFVYLRNKNSQSKKKKIAIKDIALIPKSFWVLMSVVFFFTMGRYSNSFINLRIRESGWDVALIPLVLCCFELVFAFIVWPAGYLADKVGIKKMLFIGISFLSIADAFMLFFPSKSGVLIGVLILGIHFGFSEGIISACISKIIPESIRGSAFGIYYIICGFTILISNNMAGILSDYFSSTNGALYLGIISTIIALLIFLKIQKKIII